MHYRFHATDGDALMIDTEGCALPGGDMARAFAGNLACGLMLVLGPSQDWSAWAVHVYDARGGVRDVVPFAEALPHEVPVRGGEAGASSAAEPDEAGEGRE